MAGYEYQLRWRRLSTGSIELQHKNGGNKFRSIKMNTNSEEQCENKVRSPHLQQLTCTARKLGSMAALGRYRSLCSRSPLSIRGLVDRFPWQIGGSVVDDPWSVVSPLVPVQ